MGITIVCTWALNHFCNMLACLNASLQLQYTTKASAPLTFLQKKAKALQELQLHTVINVLTAGNKCEYT